MEYLEIISQRKREKSIQASRLRKEHKGLMEQLATLKRLINNNAIQRLKLQGSITEVTDLEYIWKENLKEETRKKARKSTKKNIKKKNTKKK